MFEIISRGEGFVAWATHGGYRFPADFIDVLSRTPEPLLPLAQMSKLRALLRALPPRVDRRSSSQLQEGRRLALLVEASDTDSVIDEVKVLLCSILRGQSILPRGRPKRDKASSSERQYADMYINHVYEQVVKYVSRPDTMDVPLLAQRVPIYEDLKSLPLKERALKTTHRMLTEGGKFVPSPARLRNRLSAYRVRLRKDREMLAEAATRHAR